VTTPICAASRASIFTGLHERTHKYTFQTGPLLPEYMETSYPKLLKMQGTILVFTESLVSIFLALKPFLMRSRVMIETIDTGITEVTITKH
jgi:hypothetical protein